MTTPNIVAIQQIGRNPKTACTRCQWPAFILYVQAPSYEEGEKVYAEHGGLCEDCLRDRLREQEEAQ